MKLFSANFYEKSQKYFTRTGGSVDAAPIIAGAGLTKHCFRSRVLYLDGMGKQIISKASSISKSRIYFYTNSNAGGSSKFIVQSSKKIVYT